VETPGGEFGEYLHASVAGDVPVNFKVIDGELTFSVGSPELMVTVRDTDWNASEESITNLLENQLPLEELTDLFLDLRFPLPTFFGVGIENARVSRDDSGTHTDIEISIE
jgi:hypothetical protein